MIKILFSLKYFLDKNLKNKLLILFILYLIFPVVEFFNLSFFLTFLVSLFDPEKTNWLTSIILNYNNNLEHLNIVIFSFLIIFFFASNLLMVYVNYKNYYIGEEVAANLGSRLFSRVISGKFINYIKFHPSEIIKKINIEIPILSAGVFQSILQILSKSLIFLIFLIFIFFNFEKNSIFYISIFVGIYVLIFFFFKKLLFNFGKKVSKLNSEINKNLYDSLNNFKILQLYKKEKFFFDQISSHLYSQAKYKSFGYLIGQFPKSFIEFLAFSSLAIFFLYVRNRSGDSFLSQIPQLGLIAFIGYRMLPITQQIYSSFTLIKNSLYILNTIKSDFILYKKVDFNKNVRIKNFKKINQIKLKNINFRYFDGPKIINAFNYNFKKNNIYLFFSKSGKGKTTLMNILSGFLLPENNGKLFINNNQVDFKNLENLKNYTTYMPQFTHLFDRSLYENITLDLESNFKRENNKKYFSLIKKLGLNIELKRLIKNSNKKLGHKGSTLSGGQIQRIALARAFFGLKDVVILDEPTNNLDEKNKFKVLNLIKNNKREKIIIILSHDEDLKRIASKIIQI